MSLLTFRFRHSRSDELLWLIELAKRGTFKELVLDPKHIVYETAFEIEDPVLLSIALSLASALVRDKKAEAFVNSQSLSLPMVRAVLQCYQQSWQVEDVHAFCWIKKGLSWIRNPTTFTVDIMGEPDDVMLFPCRLASRELHAVNVEAPGTLKAQTQAALTRAEVQWCPRLGAEAGWIEAQQLLRGFHKGGSS